MKINSYKKQKNKYELCLDNGNKLELYDDVILKFNLLIHKELDEKNLQEIILFNNYVESYEKALKYISSKLRTEKEIIKKLKDYNKDAINYTIDRLKKDGYLDDYLYIKSYINDKVNLGMEGPNKILYDLKKLGFQEEDIQNYLNTFTSDIWLNKIEKYIQKKIHSNHNMSGLFLKQKVYNELKNKGFFIDHINLILDKYSFQDDNLIYEKEYQKLKNKLASKYNDSNLDYQIKIRLMKKGFRP